MGFTGSAALLLQLVSNIFLEEDLETLDTEVVRVEMQCFCHLRRETGGGGHLLHPAQDTLEQFIVLRLAADGKPEGLRHVIEILHFVLEDIGLEVLVVDGEGDFALARVGSDQPLQVLFCERHPHGQDRLLHLGNEHLVIAHRVYRGLEQPHQFAHLPRVPCVQRFEHSLQAVLQVPFVVLSFRVDQRSFQHLLQLLQHPHLQPDVETLVEALEDGLLEKVLEGRAGMGSHGVEGVDEVVDFFWVGTEKALEQDPVEGRHVVPADHVIDPLVVDLATRYRLPQLLVHPHVRIHLLTRRVS